MRSYLQRQLERLIGWRTSILRIRLQYRQSHHRSLNLIAPRRFTEKVQWRKLFDMNPVFGVLSDKLAVRSFIAERVGSDHLIPLLWTGIAKDIPFDRLQPPFVLKSTHASGQFLLIGADEPFQKVDLQARADAWLAQPFGITQDEPGYVPVPPRLMIEKTIVTESGERPEEVRLFVFDGKVGVINTVFVEDGAIRNGAFHTREWTELGWHFSRRIDRTFQRPVRLDDMIRIAERLGRDLDQVRIDFYDCGERFYIGEMTLYSWSGMSPFQPDEADFVMGAFWRLRQPLLRAVQIVLFGRREVVHRSGTSPTRGQFSPWGE